MLRGRHDLRHRLGRNGPGRPGPPRGVDPVVPGHLELEYLEGIPYRQVMDCECQDLRDKRQEYVDLRETFRSALEPTAGGPTDREEVNDEVDSQIAGGGGDAVTEWATHPSSCVIRQGDLSTEYSTQRSLEVGAESGYWHEVVHRDRCCAMNQARADWDAARGAELQHLEATRMVAGLSDEQEARYQQLLAERPQDYVEWSEDPENEVHDEIEGYDAGIAFLDRWLAEHCPGS